MDYTSKIFADLWKNVKPVDPDGMCPICQEKKKKPVIVRCGHIFCRDCLKKYYKKKRKELLEEFNTNLLSPKCPICRKSILRFRHWPLVEGQDSESIRNDREVIVEPAVEATTNQVQVSANVEQGDENVAGPSNLIVEHMRGMTVEDVKPRLILGDPKASTSKEPEVIQIDSSQSEAEEEMIAEKLTPDSRKIVYIESDLGNFRGRNAKYLVKYQDDSTGIATASECKKYPEVWQAWYKRTRAANQREYMKKQKEAKK